MRRNLSIPIAFIYANDLGAADPDGKNPRLLTTQSGVISAPVFSPDGPPKKLARPPFPVRLR